MNPRVLVIIPAYNESATIGDVLRHLREAVPDYDVLVVDDGSRDHTSSVVKTVSGVKLVVLPYNLGIGATMQTGYKFAFAEGYDIAVQCDADGQHPVEEIPRIVDEVQSGTADLIIGSRYVADSDYRPSLFRRIGKSIMSRLVDTAVGGGITDTTSGFRAANRKVIATFVRHYPEDYPEAESLVILYKAGLKAAEIPVQMHERQGGQSSISPLKAAYYMVKVALAIFVSLFRDFSHASTGAHDANA